MACPSSPGGIFTNILRDAADGCRSRAELLRVAHRSASRHLPGQETRSRRDCYGACLAWMETSRCGAQLMSRSSTSTREPAPASKSSSQIGRWKRSAGAALVGFGGLAVGASRQSVRPLARSLRATQRIGMRCRRVVNDRERTLGEQNVAFHVPNVGHGRADIRCYGVRKPCIH